MIRARLAGPIPTFAVALLFAGIVAVSVRIAWNPAIKGYFDLVPIGALFAAFFWDRLLPSWPRNARHALCDAMVIVLALMRVFVPPLPFISGHALFTTYAVLTARRWPLRAIAVGVWAHVVYSKLSAPGGWRSMLGGFAVAAIAAAIRASWLTRHGGPSPFPLPASRGEGKRVR